MKNTSTLAAVLLALVSATEGCKKSEKADASKREAQGGVATSASVTNVDASCDAFVSKLASFESKPQPESERRVAMISCLAASPGARTCVVGAVDKAAADKCLVDDIAKDAKEKTITIRSLGLEGTLAREQAEPPEDGGTPRSDVEDAHRRLFPSSRSSRPSLRDALAPGAVWETENPDGTRSATIPHFNVTIAEAKENDPKTLKEAANSVKNLKPTNLHKETLSDGWLFTFQHKDRIENYGVSTRRTIGGKDYHCTATIRTLAHQKIVADFCKSLAVRS